MSWLSDEAITRLQSASALPDLTGTRYVIVERVGSGGMGTVYLAGDAVLERRVALKILDFPDPSGELAARLLREAHILARLEHPGIVPVHDAGTLADGRVFYAMKFVEGQRLDRLIERVDTLSDRLSIFQRICEAVAFAHARGILHRDLKPENIMVGSFGEVLVMDWGIAKILPARANAGGEREESTPSAAATPRAVQASVKTAHGAILGTPGYMAPEQARGESESVDERADIYALGAILQFLPDRPAGPQESLTADKDGRVPQAGGHARDRDWKVPRPRALAAIARKAMAAEPAGRYSSVSELAQDVARYLDGLPVSAYPENVFRKVARWSSRYKVAIALVLTYLIVRAILLFFSRR